MCVQNYLVKILRVDNEMVRLDELANWEISWDMISLQYFVTREKLSRDIIVIMTVQCAG